MNDDDNMNGSYSDDSITINISDLPDTTYSYTGDTTVPGIIAQEIGSITLDSAYYNSSNITIASGANQNWAFTDEVKATTISTAKHTIDIDELAEVFETVKKRLLILTPNFEMHEKYPMLKELYNEYKAMEKLLGGPDNDDE